MQIGFVEVKQVFTKIKPTEKPATYYLELPNEKTADAIALLHKNANSNVFHSVSRTRHQFIILGFELPTDGKLTYEIACQILIIIDMCMRL